MDVELARQQWQEGDRRVEEARGDRRRYARFTDEIELVTAQLRARVGQTFTLDDLARAYDRADDWVRDVLESSRPEGAPPPDAATVADAAFHRYARGATDYAP